MLMKKIFTLIAVAAMAISANAQEISLSGLETTDFTYAAEDFSTGTYEVKIHDSDTEKTTVSVFNYIKADKNNWSPLALTGKNVEFHYKNKDKKDNFYQLWPLCLNVNGKDSRIVIKNAKAGDVITLKAASKGSTASVFVATENCTADANNPENAGAKETDPANFTEFKFTATAAGDVTIQETKGGFNLASITITSNGGDEGKDPTTPTTWDFTTTTAESFGTGWTEDSSTSGRYTYGTAIPADTYKDLREIGFAYGAGISVGRTGGSLAANAIRVDVGKQMQLSASNGIYKITGLAKNDVVKIRFASASSTDENDRTFTITNGNKTTIIAPKDQSVVEEEITVAADGDLVLQQNKGINVKAITINAALPTGIDNVIAAPAKEAKSNAIYNLAGQKVSEDYKGVVIKDGKKVVNK